MLVAINTARCRLRLRYSLRLLLLFITLAACAFAYWRLHLLRQHRRADTIHRIESLGGQASGPSRSPSRFAPSHQTIHYPWVKRPPKCLQAKAAVADDLVVAVDLGRTNADDYDVAMLADLDELEELSLLDSRVTDQGVSRLVGLTRMRWLSLEGTRVTDQTLLTLDCIENLRFVALSRTSVTAENVNLFQQRHPEVEVHIEH